MKRIIPIIAVLILSSCKKETTQAPHVPFVYTDSIQDAEGNYYHTVTIGTQVWMAENLRSTRYLNGDTIATAQYGDDWEYALGGMQCAYDNDTTACRIYGRLYNYNAITDPRGIAPPGWHIPSMNEWQTLLNYLGTNAGDQLRQYGAKYWYPPNDSATDAYGFAALPGGWRDGSGIFGDVRHKAYFWSNSYYTPSAPSYPEAWMLGIVNNLDPTLYQPSAVIDHNSIVIGCSVRCIKD
ncbi:MAG TPA: fibrobacter succinogenes major paralogous domain-containing protein [Bacteroidia bacterium]|nr:fibrobacter succinogenes major paralogous domain-containing protein [Bacteroidia bacterium]